MVASFDTPRHLRWLMAVRGVVAATLLLSALAINLILSPAESLAPFYVLAGAMFLAVLASAVVYKRWGGKTWFAGAQIAGDIALITGFVYASGGVYSPMSFLYLLPVVAAAVMFRRPAAFATAGTAWVTYALLVVGLIYGRIPAYPPGSSAPVSIPLDQLWYSLLAHLLGFLFTALLSTYLADRLRRAGEELAERHSDIARLRSLNENIVESITSGLITTDLGGRVAFLNPAGAEIIGLRSAEATGRLISGLFGFDNEFLLSLRDVLDRERRYRWEKWCRLEGEDRFLGFAASVLRDRSGQPLGLIFTYQDLTEIHALEREVRVKERMAALGEMAAGMAHELRNPLASITGSVQVLRGEQNASGEQAELMDIILRESERLDQTIRDFLYFTRPVSSTTERTDLVRLIDDSVKLLRNSRQFKGDHRVVTRFPTPEMPCEIAVNGTKQVFWNLATNALKAMPDGGTLTIQVEQEQADRVRIIFADTGIGMTEEQMERYFQPFQGGFRDGTGLGAAIVYRIVQEQDGTVHVSSAPGKGTEVRVTLPIRAPGSSETTRVQAASG